MKKIFTLLSIAGLILLLACKEKKTGPGTNEMAGEWENLIGENLDNWKGYKADSIAGWKIENGVLFASGDGSDEDGVIPLGAWRDGSGGGQVLFGRTDHTSWKCRTNFHIAAFEKLKQSFGVRFLLVSCFVKD